MLFFPDSSSHDYFSPGDLKQRSLLKHFYAKHHLITDIACDAAYQRPFYDLFWKNKHHRYDLMRYTIIKGLVLNYT